jgi:hypothetical protein
MSRVTLRQTGRAILVFHHRSEPENSSVWNCVRSVPGRDMFFDLTCPCLLKTPSKMIIQKFAACGDSVCAPRSMKIGTSFAVPL